ncbi:T9SS type A sorting domain-containing protein [Rubrivirga sp. IMCC45206]|uniref:T9SS type A sorting domain-containing protein n=1 Tax=Rubrivirga sp. IMCC45206 TaxID=3391614 RepID=UPI0039901730
MRALLLAVLTTATVAAQPVVHAVPFGAVGNAVELELAAADGGDLDGAEVSVAEAPPWLAFAHTTARAQADDDGPVARLAFDVLATAPVRAPAEVVFEVRSGGAVVATHTVRLSVAAPAVLALGAPYPNPSRGGAVVPFEVPVDGPVRLVAFDALGREVAVLADGRREPGAHEGRLPASLAPGVYVVRLVADGQALARSVVVVR